MKNNYEIRGETTAIFINRRGGRILETLIDTDDLEKVDSFDGAWCVVKGHSGNFYVKNYKNQYLHRVIMNAPKEKVVDHIHHDTLDNRKDQLRVVTNQENLMNHHPLRYENINYPKSRKKPSSQIVQGGLSWHNTKKRWRVRVTQNGKRLWLGSSKNLQEAIKILEAYKEENRQGTK